jgi:hypothetical protein
MGTFGLLPAFCGHVQLSVAMWMTMNWCENADGIDPFGLLQAFCGHMHDYVFSVMTLTSLVPLASCKLFVTYCMHAYIYIVIICRKCLTRHLPP